MVSHDPWRIWSVELLMPMANSNIQQPSWETVSFLCALRTTLSLKAALLLFWNKREDSTCQHLSSFSTSGVQNCLCRLCYARSWFQTCLQCVTRTSLNNCLVYQGRRKTLPDFSMTQTSGSQNTFCIAFPMALSLKAWKYGLHCGQAPGQSPWSQV